MPATAWLLALIALVAPVRLLARGLDDTHCNQQERDATATQLWREGGNSQLHSLTLQQTIRAPTHTAPARLPQCLPSKNVTRWLSGALQHDFDQLTDNITVDTSIVQLLNECRYSSFVRVGDLRLKHLLVDAADAQQLCVTLPTYCRFAFPTGSDHVLVSSKGDASPPLPPVLEFGCQHLTFEQQLDHFNQDETRMFAQSYWTCAAAWPEDKQQQEQSGHIIVFLGNESPLGTPKQPIVFENARRLNALVLLVEHRYYGNSKPFAVESGKLPTELYQWLTIEQVMEDTASVLAHVRAEHEVPAAVPAIVIGGSYGGMIAAYHRVTKPHVFVAALAASAPLQYIIGTQMWHRTSNSYHKHIATSLERFGGKACRKTVRDGIAQIAWLSRTAAGRRRISKVFQLCDHDPIPNPIPTPDAAFALQMDILGSYEGYAQVNDQPGLLGQVELACRVALAAAAAGAQHYEAVAAVNSYFNSNGSSSWCYGFNASDNVFIPASSEGYNSYAYQVCTQGTVFSSVLPADGSSHTLSPHYNVRVQQCRRDCEAAFGSQVPHMQPPWFAQRIKGLLVSVGGVVMTNGDCDGWAGGSFRPELELEVAASRRRRLLWSSAAWTMDDPANNSDEGGLTAPRLAFVTYVNASHCTDTHTNTWDTPGEPPAWRQQRAQAMDYAAGFAADWRMTHLSG